MYFIQEPTRDATIYEKHPERNTGADQIIEITKFAKNEPYNTPSDENAYWSNNFNSRILLEFDIESIPNGIINSEYYLMLKSTETLALANRFKIVAHPLMQNWYTGNGNYNDLPDIKNGVSWKYPLGKLDANEWNESFGTVEYASVKGGGVYNKNIECFQEFAYNTPDIYMNVTPICNEWKTTAIANRGFILKHEQDAEENNGIYGAIKYFGGNTHTIYYPKLITFWNTHSYTGSYLQVPELKSENSIIYLKNFNGTYYQDEHKKVYIGIRELFPKLKYVTSEDTSVQYRVPNDTQFSIIDYTTGETIVPFHEIGTVVNYDNNGSFINLNFNNFPKHRYYKIIFRYNSYIYDTQLTFKVI